MPSTDQPDLLTRARTAAGEVVRLKNEITTLKVLMRKAKVDAASLRRQVIEAMGPPRTRARRKKSGTGAATPTPPAGGDERLATALEAMEKVDG